MPLSRECLLVLVACVFNVLGFADRLVAVQKVDIHEQACDALKKRAVSSLVLSADISQRIETLEIPGRPSAKVPGLFEEGSLLIRKREGGLYLLELTTPVWDPQNSTFSKNTAEFAFGSSTFTRHFPLGGFDTTQAFAEVSNRAGMDTQRVPFAFEPLAFYFFPFDRSFCPFDFSKMQFARSEGSSFVFKDDVIEIWLNQSFLPEKILRITEGKYSSTCLFKYVADSGFTESGLSGWSVETFGRDGKSTFAQAVTITKLEANVTIPDNELTITFKPGTIVKDKDGTSVVSADGSLQPISPQAVNDLVRGINPKDSLGRNYLVLILVPIIAMLLISFWYYRLRRVRSA